MYEFKFLSFSFIFFQLSGAMLSQFDTIFSLFVFFLLFQLSGARHSQVDIIFSSLQSICVFFSGLINNFEDNALRNLTSIVKFLLLFFLLEKIFLKIYTLRVGRFMQLFCFLQKATNCRFLFNCGNQLTLT